MKRLLFASLVAMLSACSEEEAPAPATDTNSADMVYADTIYIGDHIITMAEGGPTVGALAVQGGKILAVGTPDAMSAHKGDETRVVELGDKALLPGFIDAHGHFVSQSMSLSTANVAPAPVGAVKNFEDIQKTLQTYMTANNVDPGEWVVARGYDDSLLEERTHPDRKLLDEVSPNNPLFIVHVSGHMLVANSAALEIAGINETTITPPGSEITRYEDTQTPTGLIKEKAMGMVYMHFPRPDPQLAMKQLAAGQAYYASMGITTVQDGGMSPGYQALLQAAASAGVLTLDITVFPSVSAYSMDELTAFDYGTYNNHLKFGGVKFMLDGSPQGKTAFLTHPYHVPPEGKDADYRGYPQIDQQELVDKFTVLYEKGIPFLAHANGDAAADQLVSAAEAAFAAHPGDHRSVMIHAQTVRDDQLDRMKALGMIPSYFAAHSFYWGDWHRDSVLGKERAFRISPTASTVARDMPFTVHNDAPVVPPNMMRLIWATVNRETRSGEVLGPDQRIDVLDALRGVTIHAAYQNFEEDTKGSLEPGKFADFVILAESPLTTDADHLKNIAISETIFRGKTIYQAD